MVLQEHDGTIRIARTDLESSLHIPFTEADDGLVTVAAPKLEHAGRILAWDDLGNLTHSEQTLGDIESVNIGVFDELYVNVTGDSMSGPLSVPFLTTNNATINTSHAGHARWHRQGANAGHQRRVDQPRHHRLGGRLPRRAGAGRGGLGVRRR